jgi:hypothetical protein
MKKERRRAIYAELVRESKDNPGYYRYNITIREIDGSEHIVPAYGKDMQDAIERLIWTERIEMITENRAAQPIFIGASILILVLSGIISVEHNNPIWVLGGLIAVILLAISANSIDSYLKK